MFRNFLAALAVAFGTPALAQSSLGIQGAGLSFGIAQDEAGVWQNGLGAAVDVAITEVHGFQGDLAFSDTDGGLIGRLGAHLFMAPASGRKYGVFATLSDVDGRSMAWATIGAEGMIGLSPDTVAEFRAGLGASDENGLDFIFGGASIARALSPTAEVELFLDVAEFDEPALRAISYEAGLVARYARPGQPWGVYASLTHSGLTGRDGTGGETRLGLGLTLGIGRAGGTDPRSRMFRTTDPVAPLLRRGLW